MYYMRYERGPVHIILYPYVPRMSIFNMRPITVLCMTYTALGRVMLSANLFFFSSKINNYCVCNIVETSPKLKNKVINVQACENSIKYNVFYTIL